MTLRGHVTAARARLVAAGIDAADASRDAVLLGRHVLGWDAAAWLTHEVDPAPPGFEGPFAALVERRAAREPVAYIRGVQEFWGREFLTSPAVLIPRPETELIIEYALQHCLPVGQAATVCDIGTGSGCLAVTLTAERPRARMVATDVSEEALNVARANAARLGVADRIAFRVGAYLAGAGERFDLIVSNPPYVTDRDYATLEPEVRAFEPHLALAAGPDGLRDIREILKLCTNALTPGGVLLMEIGHQHADPVCALVAATPSLQLLEIRNDLQGIPRIVVAQHD